MRSGNWRGLAVAVALVAGVLTGSASTSRADGWLRHTIPRETPALDYRTGDVMMAPAVPGGHYTKDIHGTIVDAKGMAFGSIHGLAGKLHGAKGMLGGLCGKCGGPSCGSCGGNGQGLSGSGCGDCGGDGCGKCGSGMLGHGGSLGGLFHKGKSGHGHGMEFGGVGSSCVGCGTTGSAQIVGTPVAPAKATSQVHAAPQVTASMQMDPVCGGCLGTGRLAKGGGCGLCGGCGRLRSLFGHGGNAGHAGMGGSPCDGCGGQGCGACGGRGMLGHGGGAGNGGCNACGGRGCGLCGGLGGLKGKLMGLPHGLAAKLTHKGQVQYFMGAGGPVPLTPGYVPYIVTTRSPRDFLAFPPFSDQIP